MEERLAPVPEAPNNPDAVGAMKHRLKTKEGKAFYAKRKCTVEPVFGIIKEVMDMRRFLLRGLEAVKGEWRLVCLAFNLKRLFVLRTRIGVWVIAASATAVRINCPPPSPQAPSISRITFAMGLSS